MAISVPNFKFPAPLVIEIKKGVPKFNVGATSPLPYPVSWNFYVCSKYLTRSNSLPNFSIVSLCIMQLFSIGFPLYVPMRFLGVLRVKMWKYCLLTPKRHYPAWIRVCWCIACQNWFNGLTSRSVERFCVQRNKKHWVVTLAIWGEVTPGAILTKCRLWGGMVGKFAFSHWLDASPLQHWSHYRVTVWWRT